MINQYPLWKYILIGLISLVGLIYALPNLYGSDPAIQISAIRGDVTEAVEQQVVTRLEQLGLKPKSHQRQNGRLLIRMPNEESQFKAKDQIALELGRDYAVALNLASATPNWLVQINALPMYLGLDLRGGVHFLIQVDMQGALKQADERYASDFRSTLRSERLRYKNILTRPEGGVRLLFRDEAVLASAESVLRRQFPELVYERSNLESEPALLVGLSEAEARETQSRALQQNITTLRNRVNEIGVAEPVIQQQGVDRIVVQLPGVQDTTQAKIILGATATLEFRMVDTDADPSGNRVPATSKLYRMRDGSPVVLQRSVMLTGEYIIDAASSIGQDTGAPEVRITLNGVGGRLMQDRTRDKIGQPMATVYREPRTNIYKVDGVERRDSWVEEYVINVATIQDQLGKVFRITGLDSTEEAHRLALLLRAGALAAPIEIVEERTIGPSLGRENIQQGVNSVILGFAMVLGFMLVYYRLFGLVANIALTLNVILLIAVLSMMQATLTLPGIAGIVLTVGMAVDANVLIFERIREEVRLGNTPQASIHAGYEKALTTIADANITTLIAAVLLFALGSGPVKGFAVTLSVGILTSMFSAILGTRAIINLIYGGRRLSALSI